MDPSKNPFQASKENNNGSSVDADLEEKAADPALADQATTFLDEVIEGDSEVPNRGHGDRFNMALLQGYDDKSGVNSRYDERDYQSHRRESFPQPHQPLKPMRSLRRKSSKTSEDRADAGSSVGRNDGNVASPSKSKSSIATVAFDPVEEEAKLVFASDPPSEYGSPKDAFCDDYGGLMMSNLKKVQFEFGKSAATSPAEDDFTEKRKHKSHRSHKYEDPQWRLRLGSEMKEDSDIPLLLKDADVEITEMADLDKDDLTSHRFGDAKGFRRHKFYLRENENQTAPLSGRTNVIKHQHQPHEVFVELDMLSGLGDDREWKETARWIKYEEDVEEGADRWGRPHVASLSFHSLINLRRLIEAGVVLLDLEERDLPGVAYRVVDQMVVRELIDSENKGVVMRALLLKHKHVQGSGEKNWKISFKKHAGSTTSLSNSIDDKKGVKQVNSVPTGETQGIPRRNSATVTTARVENGNMGAKRNGSHSGSFLIPDSLLQQHVTLDLSKVSAAAVSEEDLRVSSNKESILRRIPVGAEASVVLVGNDETLDGPAMAFIRLAESVYMPNITEVPIPVRFIFILLGPTSFELDYKEIGRSIATLMSNREFHEIAYKADDRKDLLKGIHDYLDQSIVLPPGEYEEDMFSIRDLKEKNEALRLRKQLLSGNKKLPNGLEPSDEDADLPNNIEDLRKISRSRGNRRGKRDPMKRSREWFGGLITEVKKRYLLYKSDAIDGLNFQCLAAIVFIAFAQICGSITFGGLMSTKTKGQIGIAETLLTSGVGGALFALFSGQPLLIVGTSGPLLLFDDKLFSFCEDNPQVPFLVLRTWIGIWLFVIALIFVAFEGSVLVRYFTRFTQEIFASYISLLFIYESLWSLVKIYQSHPLQRAYMFHNVSDEDIASESNFAKPNTALLCTMLMFGTFGVAWFLRNFRNSKYFIKVVRNILDNFSVPIAIGSMVLIDFLIKETETEKLKPPKGFEPSANRTSWLVDYADVGDNHTAYYAIGSVLPALLLFLLLFMEVSIGELIVSKPEYRLRKGSGFHLDVFLACTINSVICFAGLPWLSVALVRSVSHTSALVVWSTNNPPGEKPVITGVKEQRITALAVSILTGASLAMAELLKFVPLAVLYGVFLFMGVASMMNVQFIERFTLLFKQVENHPEVPYVRRVKTMKMHLYTLIQCTWLGVLWAIKSSPIALSFPFVLILLIPFRFLLLKFLFSSDELSALDVTGSEKKETPAAASLEHPAKTPVPSVAKTNGKSFDKRGYPELIVDSKVTGVPYENGNGGIA